MSEGGTSYTQIKNQKVFFRTTSNPKRFDNHQLIFSLNTTIQPRYLFSKNPSTLNQIPPPSTRSLNTLMSDGCQSPAPSSWPSTDFEGSWPLNSKGREHISDVLISLFSCSLGKRESQSGKETKLHENILDMDALLCGGFKEEQTRFPSIPARILDQKRRRASSLSSLRERAWFF
jgi:hypothetical protein